MNEYFDYKIAFEGVSVKYSNSPVIEEREIHTYHEILCCDERKVVLRTENARTEIYGKALVIIPKGCYHFFDIADARNFTRLKISLPDELIKKLPISVFSGGVRTISLAGHGCESVVERLFSAATTDKSGFLSYSTVLHLLAELDASKSKSGDADTRNNNTVILGVIDYVNENLSCDLSVSRLSRVANVSPSFLTHKFQNEVGISLHRYIVGKRMTRARELVERGEHPTKIYTDCGYRDYSSFYKAYLSFFGSAPSDKKQ